MNKTSNSGTTWFVTAMALLIAMPAYAGGKIDACRLITATQASKILGVKISIKKMNTSAAGPGAASMCSYQGGGVHDGFMLLAGSVKYSNAKQEIKRRQKEAVTDTPSFIPKPHFKSVDGLGDGAYLADMSGTFQLHVLSHGMVIVINRNTKLNDKTIAQAKQLAKEALGSL